MLGMVELKSVDHWSFSTRVVRRKRTWKRWQTVEMIGGRSFPYCDLWTLVQTALTLVFTCTGDPLYTFDLNCTLYFWNTAIRIEIPNYSTSNRIFLHLGCFAIILQHFFLLCEIICKHIDHPCNPATPSLATHFLWCASTCMDLGCWGGGNQYYSLC